MRGCEVRVLACNGFLNACEIKSIKNLKYPDNCWDCKFNLKNIVLETDSPYLAPTPYRGKRNESSFTDLICTKVSEIFQLSYTKVAQITTQNSIEIFKI